MRFYLTTPNQLYACRQKHPPQKGTLRRVKIAEQSLWQDLADIAIEGDILIFLRQRQMPIYRVEYQYYYFNGSNLP